MLQYDVPNNSAYLTHFNTKINKNFEDYKVKITNNISTKNHYP
jgi:hypothetical protein